MKSTQDQRISQLTDQCYRLTYIYFAINLLYHYNTFVNVIGGQRKIRDCEHTI